MQKIILLQIIRNLLQTEVDLGFLFNLEERELETLVAYISDRIGSAD